MNILPALHAASASVSRGKREILSGFCQKNAIVFRQKNETKTHILPIHHRQHRRQSLSFRYSLFISLLTERHFFYSVAQDTDVLDNDADRGTKSGTRSSTWPWSSSILPFAATRVATDWQDAIDTYFADWCSVRH